MGLVKPQHSMLTVNIGSHMKLTKIIPFITLFIFIQGCNAMKGKSDMDHMLSLMERDNPAQFEQVMYSFIESAKLGDVDKMAVLA